MNEKELALVRAALAALEQPATYKADINYAKRCLQEAIEAAEQAVVADLAFCSHPSKILEDETYFCIDCGSRVDPPSR